MMIIVAYLLHKTGVGLERGGLRVLDFGVVGLGVEGAVVDGVDGRGEVR